jgi:hypothetical protein
MDKHHINGLFDFIMAVSSQRADGIRKTISKVERSAGVPSDNPELVSLKNILKRRIRELENASDPEHPPMADWTKGRLRRLRPR